MDRKFTLKTMQEVMGNPVWSGPDDGSEYFSKGPTRTPLHVEFSPDTNCTPSQAIEHIGDPILFNAIGSLCVEDVARHHLPLLDVDGGATLKHWKGHQKLVLRSVYDGHYTPESNLRDVCGDYGIELEVSEYTRLQEQGIFTTYVRPKESGVGLVVMRTNEPIFDVVDSTSPNHSHVYVQKKFYESDHMELLQSLGAVGVLSRAWVELAETEGMGILRTPWTKKEITHTSS